MDITPIIPEGRKIITSYGGKGFTISGELYTGSVLVLPHKVIGWPVAAFDQQVAERLISLLDAEEKLEILLVGMGAKHLPLSASLRLPFKEQGIALDTMDTGAACRTYNVLLSEGRKVGAALIGVSN